MRNRLAESDLSDATFDVDSLSEEQQIRLSHLLDEYLQSLEQGVAFDARAACDGESELLEALQLYLGKLDSLYGLAVSDQRHVRSIPQTLGAFTLIREIGRGGMGIVYEATQAGIERRVALKLLPLAATLDSHQIARFKNESRASGALHHPNIVPVYSVGEAEGVHYYAMQLIVGTSLDVWVQQRRDNLNRSDQPWSSQVESSRHEDRRDDDWRTVVGWAVDAAEALHSAHELGVVHRDVKPSNLMIDHDGKIWITDFGLARCPTSQSLTKSGDVVGTMRYMSPEQACGQSALVDGRTDVYSLAATVYELLSLQSAHAGDDGPTILRSIDKHNVTPLRQLCGFVPRDLETVIAKAMSKQRDGRYETAQSFADDLRRVLAEQPTMARPPTVVDQLTRWASTHRHAVLVSAIVGLLGFVGFAVSTAMISAEKRISDASAMRLEQSERLARGAVDRLGSQMAELLADIPAAEPVRRRLLRETLDYYERFASTAGDDLELRETLAITYGKIGTLHSELGSNEEAIIALRSSERLYSEHVAATPDDLVARLTWSISQNNLAESLHRAGHLKDAAAMFSQAIRIQERLIKEDSADDAIPHLATTLNNLGLLLAGTGASTRAEACYLRAVDLLQSVDRGSDTEANGQQLASVLTNLGGLLSERDSKRAIRYTRDALARQTKALEGDRGNAKLATQVIVTLNTLGAAQAQDQQYHVAITTIRRAIEIGEQLLARWPKQPTYRRDLVISLNHLGLALSKTGQLIPAREAFEHALATQRPLAKQFTSDAETQSMLGGVLNNLGFLHDRLGDPQAAANSYAEAVKHQSLASSLAPEVDRYRIYLKKHKHNLADLEDAS